MEVYKKTENEIAREVAEFVHYVESLPLAGRPSRVALAVYHNQKEYEQLRPVDHQQRRVSYESHREVNSRIAQELAARSCGVVVSLVTIREVPLRAWLEKEGLPLNAETRAQYSALILNEK